MNAALIDAFAALGVSIPNILLPAPGVDLSKFAVVACDQHVSDPAYVEACVGDAPSALRLMLPEAYLEKPDRAARVEAINAAMKSYLEKGLLREVGEGFIYLHRTISTGVRHGLMMALDLEQYDYTPGAKSLIRATEQTIPERLPPRVEIRKGAVLELPHIMVLVDDPENLLLGTLEQALPQLTQCYDFDLMQQSGHLTGWLVQQEELLARLADILGTLCRKGDGLLFAMGDGNHSLATAKSCYEELKKNNPGVDLSNHPARYALVELENIHDPAQVFEPIHRVIFKTEPKKLLKALEDACGGTEGFPVKWYIGEESGTIVLDKNKGELAVGILQHFLDEYLKSNPGEIDYIHDDDALISFAKQENAIGFLLPAMEKSQLFRGVIADGVLPRKTFSMGHSREKRYYLEGRKIKA